MNIIKENKTNELIINKSRFICILTYVENKENVNTIMNEIKNKYKGANHYCYSYIIGNNIKYSDDGEPKGSAGLPIYNALNNYKLNNILCVVIRYFGGIKLGLGPLTRAYFNTTNECLKQTAISEYIETKNISIIFTYDIIDEIDFITKDFIVNKIFDNTIKYELVIPISIYNGLINKLNKYKIKIDE